MITQFKIHTCMGKVSAGVGSDTLSFLTESEQKEFDTIGYTGKTSQGVKSSYSEYLNSLNKGEFSVKQTKSDSGDFCEAFEIAWHRPDPGVRASEILKECRRSRTSPECLTHGRTCTTGWPTGNRCRSTSGMRSGNKDFICGNK